MDLHKACLYFLCTCAVSSAANAMDYKNSKTPSVLHQVQWDPNAIKAQTQTSVYLRAQIERLEKENEQLRNSVSQLRQTKTYQKDALYDSKIQALVDENSRLSSIVAQQAAQPVVHAVPTVPAEQYIQEIYMLQAKNKELNQRLAVSKQTLNVKSITDQGAERKLSILEQKNQTLKMKLDVVKNQPQPQPLISESELANLRSQNQSLRDTIRAQSGALKSNDNAARSAERFMSENKFLTNQLEQLKKVNEENNKNSQDLFDLNNLLRAEIAKRDEYIKKIDQKNNIAKLDERNKSSDLLASAKIDSETKVLKERYQAISQELQRERENAIEYRAKIREYQERAALQGKEVLRAASVDEQSSELRMENQELKARLELLDNQKKLTTSTIVAHKLDRVTYVDANYPPVEEVLPILDENGGKISYSNDKVQGLNLAINPEDLLAAEMIPLSGANSK